MKKVAPEKNPLEIENRNDSNTFTLSMQLKLKKKVKMSEQISHNTELKIRQAVMLKQTGMTNDQVALRMGCSKRSIQKYLKQSRENETEQVAMTLQADSVRMFDKTTTTLLDCVSKSLSAFAGHERQAEKEGRPVTPAASAFLKTATAAAAQLGQLFALPVIAARASQVEDRSSAYKDFLQGLSGELERAKRQAASIASAAEEA